MREETDEVGAVVVSLPSETGTQIRGTAVVASSRAEETSSVRSPFSGMRREQTVQYCGVAPVTDASLPFRAHMSGRCAVAVSLEAGSSEAGS